MMSTGRTKRKTAGTKKRAIAIVMLLAFMMAMFAGCGTADSAEGNTILGLTDEPSVDSDELNEMLEAMYAGETGSEDVISAVEAYLADSSKSYDIEVTNVDTSNFPQVSVYYTVYDNTGAIIYDNDRSNFVVMEENSSGKTEMQMVSTVKPVKTTQTINLSIVMDLSTSMRVESNIDYLKEAVTDFVSLINPTDSRQVSLIGFTTEIEHFIPFTSSEDTIISEVNSMEADGKTALYDSLYWAMTQVSEQDGQKYVIAFTDGADNSSQFGYDDIIEISKELGIPIYILGLGNSVETYALRKIADESGGEFITLQNMDDTLDMYTEIFEKQSEQSVLIYTTTNTTEQDFWRTLDVYYIGQDDSATGLAQYNPVKTTVETYADTTLEDLGGADLAVVVDQSEFVGTWEGFYFNNSGKMDLTLDITEISDSGEVSAVFSFTPTDDPGDADRTGSFAMAGYIDSATNTVYLEGTDWLTKAPDGYQTLDIYGQIFDNTFNGYFYRDYKPEFYLAKQ